MYQYINGYFGDLPWIYERKRIKKTMSDTAWALIVSEIFSAVFAGLLTLAVSAAGYERRYDAEKNVIMDAPLVLCGYTSVTFSLICTLLIFGYVMDLRISDIFGTERLSAKKIFLTVIISLGIANAIYVVNELLGIAFYSAGYEVAAGTADPDTMTGVIAEVTASVILAPVFEEMFYRGLIMRSLCRVSKRFAIFASAAVFGIIHGNIYQFLLGFFVGIVFAYADIKMNSVLPSIAAHIAVNAHIFIYSAVSGEYAEVIIFSLMAVFIISGTAALLYVLKSYGIKFPEYTEYHKRRTLPVLVRSVPVWIFTVYSVFSLIASFSKVS